MVFLDVKKHLMWFWTRFDTYKVELVSFIPPIIHSSQMFGFSIRLSLKKPFKIHSCSSMYCKSYFPSILFSFSSYLCLKSHPACGTELKCHSCINASVTLKQV